MANPVSPTSPPAFAEDTPARQQQRQTDRNYLRALSIFHYGLAVLAAGITTYAARGLIGTHQMLSDMPPEFRRHAFSFDMIILPVVVLFGVGCVVNTVSGWCLVRHKAWVFSLVVAGFDFFYFPVGTVLALFTLIVLLRGSVGELYGRRTV